MCACGPVVNVLICDQCAEIQLKEKDGMMALTDSFRPGTERLLRPKASSLGSDPAADRSISERL